MNDQAAQLRQLVLQAESRRSPRAPPPRLVLVAGGKGGVGATSVSVGLSIALARLASRVVLVDTHLYRAGVASMCGIEERGTIADILAGRRDIHEILQRGPAGVQIAPGQWAPAERVAYTERTQGRLIEQLLGLRRHAEIVVLDAGAGPGEALARFWSSADEAIVVTTGDRAAVLDAYATIKTMHVGGNRPRLGLIVNRSPDEGVAAEVHARIARSCRHFLGVEITPLGRIPDGDITIATDGNAALDTIAERLLAQGQPARAKAA